MRLRSGERTTTFARGQIRLIIRAGTHLHWYKEPPTQEDEDDPWDYQISEDSEWLDLEFQGQGISLRVHQTGTDQGFVPAQSAPDDEERILERAIAHWVNLPHFPFGDRLHNTLPDGGWQEWGGRHELILEGWHCRLDGRPDLHDSYKEAKAEYLNIITHVMEIRRADGTLFSSADVAEFLTGMQFAMSFALSRWVAPIFPLGFSQDGQHQWSGWAAWHVDPPMHGSGRWWVSHRPQDLWSFLSGWFARWKDASERQQLSFLVTSALAAGEGAFVEQRLMTCLAAIENLSWITEVQTRRLTESEWRGKKSHWRIRKLLRDASISVAIDPARTPALAAYAREFHLGDGPIAVTRVRDGLTHPKNTEDLYNTPGLVAEVSRLARRYLDLLLLHNLNYEGRVSDRTRVRGWSGESEEAPWVVGPFS